MGGAAQEAVAVGQDFEGAGAADDFAAFDLPADDADDELAAGHAGVFGNALSFGEGEQLGHGQAIEIVEPQGRGGAASCHGGSGWSHDGAGGLLLRWLAHGATPCDIPAVIAGNGHRFSSSIRMNGMRVGLDLIFGTWHSLRYSVVVFLTL